jgi:hypothetical protein
VFLLLRNRRSRSRAPLLDLADRHEDREAGHEERYPAHDHSETGCGKLSIEHCGNFGGEPLCLV